MGRLHINKIFGQHLEEASCATTTAAAAADRDTRGRLEQTREEALEPELEIVDPVRNIVPRGVGCRDMYALQGHVVRWPSPRQSPFRL